MQCLRDSALKLEPLKRYGKNLLMKMKNCFEIGKHKLTIIFATGWIDALDVNITPSQNDIVIAVEHRRRGKTNCKSIFTHTHTPFSNRFEETCYCCAIEFGSNTLRFSNELR